MNTYKNFDWLLGGGFNDDEEDTRKESLVEALSFFYGKLDSFRYEQEDIDDAEAFDLNEDLERLEDAIENIASKLLYDDGLNESAETLIVAIPAAVAAVMGGIPIGSALFKTWTNEGTLLPRGLHNATHKIGKWLNSVTGAEKAKRRAILAEQFKKSNAKATPSQINAYISRIEAQEKADNERIKNKVMYGKREDLKVKGSQEVKKPYHLMDDKEKAEYKRTRLPNKGK